MCISPGNDWRLQTLCDERCGDAAGALHMYAFQALVDVCQHLGTQGAVAGFCLECVQLSKGEGI